MPPRKAGGAQPGPHLLPRQLRASSVAPTPRTPRRSRPSRRPGSRVATSSVRPARYRASTSCSAHHVPIPSTARSEARQTSTARAAPNAVTQDREVVPERPDEAAVPAARPVAGEAGLDDDNVERRARAASAATPSRGPGSPRRRAPRLPAGLPRAAGRARPVLSARASSHSGCAAQLDPTGARGAAFATPRRPRRLDEGPSSLGNRRFPGSGIPACGQRIRASGSEILLRLTNRWRTGLEPATTGITTRGSTN